MKAYALLTAAAILLLGAGAWGVLRLVTFSKPPPEAKWCDQLSSPDSGERCHAYRTLGQIWKVGWEKDSPDGTGREKLSPDEFVLAVMESLRSESSPEVAMWGVASLIFAPISEEYRPQFEALIASVVMKQMDERDRVWRKSRCADFLWSFDALRSSPPSEGAITLCRETLAQDCYPELVQSQLRVLIGRKSDLLPLKDAIAALLEFPEPKVRAIADLLLKQMKLPVTPEERRERVLRAWAQ
jgi:hypothetical protein